MSGVSNSVRVPRPAVIAAFMLALAVLLCCPLLAHAAEDDWTVTFTGSAMTSDGSADINKQLNGLQPGDSATFKVKLSNDCDDAANWYMKNEVLKTMEENAARGGSYTYRLTYTAPDGTESVIIGNDIVSGDGEGTKGLFDATTATGEWFFLGEFPAHGTGEVTLYVAIDPESHGNSYFDTTAKLQLSFAAEVPGKQMVVETTGGTTTTQNRMTLPSTGDMIKFGSLIAIVIVALVGWRLVHRRANAKGEGGK